MTQSSRSQEELRTAHAAGRAGLGDPFAAVAGHLHSTLTDLDVPGELVDEVMAIVGSTEPEVLGR